MSAPGWIACAVAAWLVGSIPFGVLIGRAHGVDVREHGSRNIGATNVGRLLGRRWGFLCFALDAAKGAVPVAVAGFLGGAIGRPADEVGAATLGWWLLVLAAALLGHMWSPFIGFRGGKGVATGFGGLLGFWPLLAWPALIVLAVWIVTVALSRMVSLASVIAAVALPITTFILTVASAGSQAGDGGAAWTPAWPILAATALLALVVVVRHRSNIARIARGEEPCIGASRRAPAAAAAGVSAAGGPAAQNAPDGGA